MSYNWKKGKESGSTYGLFVHNRPVYGPGSREFHDADCSSSGQAHSSPRTQSPGAGIVLIPWGGPALCSLCRPLCWFPVDILGARPSLWRTAGHRQLVTQEPVFPYESREEGQPQRGCGCLQDPEHITGNSCKASEGADNSWALRAVLLYIASRSGPRVTK